MNILKRFCLSAAMAAAAFFGSGTAEASTPLPVSLFLPNSHAKSLTTPVGWGSAFGSFFVGFGGTSPAPYSDDSDGGMAIGVGIGNPIKNLGFQAALVSLDMNEWDRYALNLHLHRYLGCARSIAIGVENIMLSDGSDAEESFYIVYSHGVLCEPFINKEKGTTRLHFSVGAGTGRFRDKSPQDIASGKSKHGTTVFGNVSYELFDELNLIADWNGVNLNAGISKTFAITERVPLVISIGAADLTDYSGDGVRLIGAIGTGITL